MEAWLKEALEKGRVRELSDSATRSPPSVYGEVVANPWYEGGVSCDWTALHRRIKGSDAEGTHPCADLSSSVASLAEAGTKRLSSSSGDLMLTVIEVASPYWMQSLDKTAQDMSAFSVSKETLPQLAGAPGGNGDFRLFTFLKGPPGQVSTRNDVGRVLDNVAQQLRQQGLDVHLYLGSFIIFAKDFNALLGQTAAVHKALKGAGMELNIHASALGPRVVTAVDGQWWTAMPLEAIGAADDVAGFATDLFYQWLEDSYVWRCLAPVKAFPDVTGTDKSVEAQQLKLFERFVRSVVLPSAAKIGFRGLQESLPEEGGDLLELATPLLAKKRVLCGPQKWSTLDLRLALGCIGAYAKNPRTVLQATLS